MFLHLSRLKARVLPAELVKSDRIDERFAALAEGVAAAFDGFTGRTLARGVGVTEIFAGGAGLYLPARYPVESVASVTVRYDDGTTDALTTEDYTVSKQAGLIRMRHLWGRETDEITVVYTGGYFIDTSEFHDEAVPSGATAIPKDIVDAWVLQCDHEARARKLMGGTSGDDLAAALAQVDLLPRVERVLRTYSRMA